MALDLEKFRKVWALACEGATDGERTAARKRAEAMATKAGMTLTKAVNAMHAPKPGQPLNMFAGFDDYMEAKEPGYKIKQAQLRAEREAKDAARRAELLATHGSEAAIFARGEREILLFDATSPLVTEWNEWTDNDDGTVYRFAEIMDGHKPKHGYWWREDVTPAIREAVTSAYLWPARLADALLEVEFWETLRQDRELFTGGEWRHYPEVECRIALLEAALTNEQPAETFEDIRTRFAWGRWLAERSTAKNDEILERLEADLLAYHERASGFLETALEAINNLERRTREAGFDAAVSVLTAARESGIERPRKAADGHGAR